MELHDAGARVSLISPSNHPARALSLIRDRSIYRAWAPGGSLESAIRRLRPDIVIPCDEITVRDLHDIARDTPNPLVRQSILRSTSPVRQFPTIVSRAALLSLASQLGVRVPKSQPLPNIGALDQWMEHNALPFVLKADGSWAGFGVRIVSDSAAAADTYAAMTKPASGRLALRESLLEGNYFGIRPWLRRERPSISVQQFIDGWPANIGIACWQGEVLASVCAEAVATTSATGPSTVARIIRNPEMEEAALRVAGALGLSGMIGFDFMIESATGDAHMIEMNPRNTPICAMRLDAGRDLAEALVAHLAGRPRRERPARTDRDIVVFFPDTWQEDPSSLFLRTGYHDVPWEEPGLVRVLMQPERRERYGILRGLRRLWLMANKGGSSPR
jgi:hypothetical protein